MSYDILAVDIVLTDVAAVVRVVYIKLAVVIVKVHEHYSGPCSRGHVVQDLNLTGTGTTFELKRSL